MRHAEDSPDLLLEAICSSQSWLSNDSLSDSVSPAKKYIRLLCLGNTENANGYCEHSSKSEMVAPASSTFFVL